MTCVTWLVWPRPGAACGEGAESRADGGAGLLDGCRRRVAAGACGGRLPALPAPGRRPGGGDYPGLRRRPGAVPGLVSLGRPGPARGGPIAELVRGDVADRAGGAG